MALPFPYLEVAYQLTLMQQYNKTSKLQLTMIIIIFIVVVEEVVTIIRANHHYYVSRKTNKMQVQMAKLIDPLSVVKVALATKIILMLTLIATR